MDDFFNNDFKAIRCTGHRQSICKLCFSNKDVYPVYRTPMMYKVDHVSGIYCGNCVENLRSLHYFYKLFPVPIIAIANILRERGVF